MTHRPLTPAERAIVERYLEARRARPQARALPSASMAVNRVMRPLAGKGRKRGSSALALADLWPDIMGPRWSKISAPVRFRGSKDGRTLVISAPGPAASLILAASGPILERLNAHLGAGSVARLQVVQAAPPGSDPVSPKRGLTPSEDAALREGLTQVRNERLKDVLERLGREVIRHQP
ncbi:DciA family protein [uncultured Algimonas sp.]|uniref:DciA family protein n=1 Tax=uncultured Algimonas sp. TaxID=1547920 RepID=UPI002626F444|nr:DciA family protein [uncultured Algimonas sp.]